MTEIPEIELKENSRKARRAYFVAGIAVAAFGILTRVFRFITDRFIFPALGLELNGDYSSLTTMLRIFVPMYCVALPLVALFFLLSKRYPLEKKPQSVPKLLQCICIAYLFIMAGNMIGAFIKIFMLAFGLDSGTGATEIIVNGNTLYSIVFSVVLAPVVEEFVFRKLIIDRTHVYGGRVAVIVSALMFGLFHGNFTQMFGAFAVGLLLGYVYLKTGKIVYTMIIHAAVNLVANLVSIVLRLMRSEMDGVVNGGPEAIPIMLGMIMLMLLYYAAINGLIACGVVFLVKNVRKVKFVGEPFELPAGKGMKAALLNVGMIVFFAFCVYMIVTSIVPSTIFSQINRLIK